MTGSIIIVRSEVVVVTVHTEQEGEEEGELWMRPRELPVETQRKGTMQRTHRKCSR